MGDEVNLGFIFIYWKIFLQFVTKHSLLMSSRCYLHWHSLSLEPIFQKGVFFFLWGRGKSQIGFCLLCLRFLYKFTMVFLSLQGDSIYIYPTIAKRVHSVTLKFEKRGTSSSFDIYIFCFVKNGPQVPFIRVLRTSIKKKNVARKISFDCMTSIIITNL